MNTIKCCILFFCFVIALAAQPDSSGVTACDTGIEQEQENISSEHTMVLLKNSALRMAAEAELLQQKAVNLYESADRLDSLGSKDEADRIRAKARVLHEHAESLKQKSESLYQDASGYGPQNTAGVKPDQTSDKSDQEKEHSYFRRQAISLKDTIHYVSREGARELLNSFTKKRSSRERGYGGGLSLTPGVFAVNISEVKELNIVLPVKYESVLSKIEGRFETFFLMGGSGYGGLGNGLRIGGEGLGGARVYSSEYNDTTTMLEVGVAFGGAHIEKCFVNRNMNFVFGGTLGGGKMTVLPSYSTHAFSDIDDLAESDANKLKARFLLLEFHGGFTYTLVSWLHLGLNLSTPLFIATDGFKGQTEKSYTNGFFTINPGLKIKIVVGNLG